MVVKMDPIEKRLTKAADLFKVLANPTRLRILLLLSQQGSLNVTAIQDTLQLEQALLSHHLIKMKDKGLLQSRRQGKEWHYSIVDAGITAMLDTWLNR